MSGKEHKMFAPVFTLLATIIILGVVKSDIPMILFFIPQIGAALTAIGPDADLYTHLPVGVIWSNKPFKKNEGGKTKVVRPPREFMTKLLATIFKFMGVKEHRDWRSHSLVFHGLIGIACIKFVPTILSQNPVIAYGMFIVISLLFVLQFSDDMKVNIANKLKSKDLKKSKILNVFLVFLSIPIIALISQNLDFQGKAVQNLLYLVVLGMVLGYWSHLIGDAPNKGGIPIFFKNVRITEKIMGKNLSKITRSSNKAWNKFVMVSVAIGLLYIIAPEMVKSVFSTILRIIFK